MAKLIIKGHSDDIVSFKGDFYDEVYPEYDADFMILVSDGTAIEGSYGRNGGFWRFNVVKSGSATYDKFNAVDDDGPDYSDIITLEGDAVTWVAMSQKIIKATK